MQLVKLKLTAQEQKIIDNSSGARFLSVDPLTSSYPWYSPYQYAGNTPIQAIDLDGLEEYIVTKELFKSGATKRITIQYTVQKDDITKNVNGYFREVLKTNPDGTVQLGGYLTDQKVIRIVVDANGKESSNPDNKLTKQEQAIVNQKSANESPTEPQKDMWDLTIGKKIYNSETVRNTDILQDKIAEKNFIYHPPTFNNTQLKPNSALSNFNGSNNYYYGGAYNSMGGQLGNDLIASLQTLAGQLKNAENIKSITVNLNQGINANAGTSQYNVAQQYGQAAVVNMVNLLQAQLKGTGIKVNAGTTNTAPNVSPADLISSGKPTGVNIQIN